MAKLNSIADLRRVIPEPRPTTKVKILEALDEQSIDFLKRCPFALVSTTSPDGTIEAVRVIAPSNRYVVGVQWHPEYDWQTDSLSRRIFEDFGEAVRRYVAGARYVAAAAD